MVNPDLAERRRREILEAAYKVFAEKGYHATNISDIAAELNLGHGTFYRYFKNKLDIFSHVLDMVIQRITQVVSEERPDRTDTLEEYRAQSQRIGERLFATFLDDPHLTKIIFFEALGIDDRLNEKVQAAFDLFGQYTAMYLQNGVQKGFLRPDLSVQETAFAVNALIFEGVRRVSRSGDSEAARALWLRSGLDLMFRGVGR